MTLHSVNDGGTWSWNFFEALTNQRHIVASTQHPCLENGRLCATQNQAENELILTSLELNDAGTYKAIQLSNVEIVAEVELILIGK